MELTQESQRVLGSLMEKEMVTPDGYPMSLNALILACNQRSSREPVMNLDEDQVRSALDVLEAFGLVAPARDGGRVTKYEHRIRTVLTLRRDETAVLCLLLLRGAQTPGELRTRAERMYQFDDLAQMQATVERMASREQPLVMQMARQAGSREARWMHLLGEPPTAASVPKTQGETVASEELASLHAKVAELEQRIQALELRSDQTQEGEIAAHTEDL